jgi:hypothetical protein
MVSLGGMEDKIIGKTTTMQKKNGSNRNGAGTRDLWLLAILLGLPKISDYAGTQIPLS